MSVKAKRVLCVGNGGMVYRNRKAYTHQFNGSFLADMGALFASTCFCNWMDLSDDPLCQSEVDAIHGVSSLGLPALRGSIITRTINAVRALARLSMAVARSHFVYLYWPGRLPSLASRICRTIKKPYGIYLRGEVAVRSANSRDAFKHARFVLATGAKLCLEASPFCADVENATPMTPLRRKHVRFARRARDDSQWNVLYVGRIEERKGVYDLLEAVAALVKAGCQVSLTMVGHCDDPDTLCQRMPLALEGRVHCPGVVTDFETLMSFYDSASVFVLPSHDEGFPRVLYEAMAAGVPIVTTFVGSIAAIMKDMNNCLKVEPYNPLDIADKVRRVLSDGELQRRLSESGRRTILDVMKGWDRSHAVQVAERVVSVCSGPR